MQKVPSLIKFHKKSQELELGWGSTTFRLSSEYLRVYSPSAEVRGHGKGNEVLQEGKKEVHIRQLEPVGSYALKIFYDDGHDSGLYSWDYLYDLATHHDHYWQQYLHKLKTAQKSRQSSIIQIRLKE